MMTSAVSIGFDIDLSLRVVRGFWWQKLARLAVLARLRLMRLLVLAQFRSADYCAGG
jgi:hypothetical protein